MLTKEEKKELVEKFGATKKDSGAPEVQIAILTKDILQLTEHLKVHRKDIVTRRSLLKKVEKRKSLLSYLKNKNFDKYSALIKELNLRK